MIYLVDTNVLLRSIQHKVIGRQVHDARLVAAMKVHSVTHLLTFNTDDFKRYDEITIVNPQNVI